MAGGEGGGGGLRSSLNCVQLQLKLDVAGRKGGVAVPLVTDSVVGEEEGGLERQEDYSNSFCPPWAWGLTKFNRLM